MASSNKSQTPLYDLPEEIFQQIISHITEPDEYFHLAATSKAMMNKLNPRREVLVLETKKFHEYILQFPPIIRRIRLVVFPYNSIMNWALRTKQPMDILWNVVQDYLAYAPYVIYGKPEWGLRPVWCYALLFNNMDALHLLIDAGLAP
ncbi:uncharacterized protein F4807DRAFT_473108 [Annulohypoxylon truncatum]|uniref:uncharacterized protein n=1 Tax=Annulohypoxylon truncatum TaxID=327061 RepID=UPI0020087585|nr:uncharacterized protein F4807DRAFT_473108 [Annulohypoxylon truncatum]KAI1211688.1 hypothetical protein F4807DRAFT_473108 [Annulohypoxylon truncatum]